MPLFVCTRCHHVENTGLSSYFAKELEAHERGETFEPICSQCETDEWHGQFPRMHINDTHYVEDGKFLKHKSEML
jgi:hypothetical protein